MRYALMHATLMFAITITTIFAENSCPLTQASQILRRIQEENIKFIRYQFVDLLGNPKSYIIDAALAPSTLETGVNIDGSSITGFSAITKSDLLLVPDLATFCLLPDNFDSGRMAQIICDVYLDNNSPLSQDPRSILKTACTQLEARGYQLLVSCELEFFLVRRGQSCSENKSKSITLNMLDGKGYCEHSSRYNTAPILLKILETLRFMGLNPEKTHHEVASGQHEITLRYTDALTAADRLVVAKQVIRYTAEQYGYDVLFMPKPLAGHNGSGLHTNFSLWDITNNTNAFYDAQAELNLSSVARQCIAGVLTHIREITALLNPIINSYKRLVVGYEAPVYIAWGSKNRSTLVRIPLVDTDNWQQLRAELRSPDPSCNPYLAIAAILHACLDGITQNYILGTPTTTNLFEISSQEREELGIQALPSTLGESLSIFESSPFVTQCFGSLFQATYAAIKKQEAADFALAVTDWELKKYREM